MHDLVFIAILAAYPIWVFGRFFLKAKFFALRQRLPNSKLVTDDWWEKDFDHQLKNGSYAQKAYDIVTSKYYREGVSYDKIPADHVATHVISNIWNIILEKQHRNLKLSKIEQQVFDLWLFCMMTSHDGASYWFLDYGLESATLKNVIQTYRDLNEPAQANLVEKLFNLATEYHDAVAAKNSTSAKSTRLNLKSQLDQSEKYLLDTYDNEAKILNYILQNTSSFKI